MNNIETNYKQIIQDASQECKNLNCDEFSFILYSKKDFNLQLLNDKIESIQHGETKDFYARILKDNKKCTFSTNANINEQIKKNVDFLQNISEDKYAAIDNSEVAEYSIENFKGDNLNQQESLVILNEFNNGIKSVDHRIQSNNNINVNHSTRYYLNSYGLYGESKTLSSSFGLFVSLNTSTSNVEIYESTEIFNAGMMFEYGKEVAERLLSKQNEVILKTGEYDVLLTKNFVELFSGQFIYPLFGSNISAKNSFLSDKLNKKVFPENISFVSNPENFKFDSDGVKLQKQYLVKDGIVENFILNKYNAKKLNMQTTGHCLSLFGEGFISIDFNSNMKKSEITGRSYLEIQDYSGKNINSANGDFSALVNGFIIENGVRTGAFNDVILSGNLLDLFYRMFLLDDYEKKSHFGIHCPSIFIEKCKICGK